MISAFAVGRIGICQRRKPSSPINVAGGIARSIVVIEVKDPGRVAQE
jgi:hypothetical protein